jgi:hypothetical protein
VLWGTRVASEQCGTRRHATLLSRFLSEVARKRLHSLGQKTPCRHHTFDPRRPPHIIHIPILPDIPVSYARYFPLGAFDGEFDTGERDGRGRGLMAGPSVDSQVRHVGMDRCRVRHHKLEFSERIISLYRMPFGSTYPSEPTSLSIPVYHRPESSR